MPAGRFRLGRRGIRFEEGDTVAAAMYRAGVRTFSRSIKHHRRRGLYCGTGECPNCLVSIDGVPGVRSCVTAAREGMRVRREGGWPSVERDALAILDRLHPLLPVGFYHKAFIRPRWAWPLAERVIRRVAGVGRLPPGSSERIRGRQLRCDVLVVGGGDAGKAAALEAARRGDTVVLCDQGSVHDAPEGVEVLEGHAALGIYDGPLVPLAGPGELVEVHPGRIVVATGGTETHPLFPGNDLPGVMLGRAAAGLARCGVGVGARAVVVAGHDEGIAVLEELRRAGVRVVAAVVPPELAARVPEGVRALVGATIVRAEGRGRLRYAVLRDAGGVIRGIACDAFVVSLGLGPRDDLLRMAGAEEPVEAVGGVAEAAPPTAGVSSGYVCLCEDVATGDLRRAWAEGFRSSELLKRYTTATMGPCQGAMCGRHLAAFAAARSAAANAGRTTARPPVRPVALEVLAAPVREVIKQRTAL
ncbi:MAG TPA: 2Fe-2S iron-sulfur cluster-binding protein, partial [Actinomycetota bacterium]|nr:2Fe-2S iron-sulfur cluster-binding protein [Actinomycetota bacterium]